MTRPARTISIVLGVIALLLGGLWVGQGLGFIPGSSMTGDKMWFWIGLVVVLVGIVLIVVGVRRRAVTRRP
jgi:hypothetical protein